MAIDETKVEEFVGQVVGDMAASASAAANYVGTRLGLYSALQETGATTSDALAEETGTNPRLVKEWLDTQAAGGYVEYDPGARTYELPPEHGAVLTDQTSEVYLAGLLNTVASLWADTERVEAAFRGDGSVPWGDHDERLYDGVEQLFAPIYRHQLIDAWIPALDGVEDRLRAGARVADIGCGRGVSTIVMANTFPESEFVGLDAHAESIDAARKYAADAGVTDRVDFEVADITRISGHSFDLVCFFDCLHDMGDPLAAATRAREMLGDDGSVLLVEPMAADRIEENVNPVSRLYYAGSLFVCTPSSLSQEGRVGLGAQAGPERLHGVLRDAGFSTVRTALETPFNLVIEARP